MSSTDDATLAAYGTPYCVVNNASIFPRASVLDMTPEVWDRTFKVNITAPWLIAKGFGPHTREQWLATDPGRDRSHLHLHHCAIGAGVAAATASAC